MYFLYQIFSFHPRFCEFNQKIKTVTKSVNALKCQFNMPLIKLKNRIMTEKSLDEIK